MIMLSGMTSAEQLGAICLVILIAAPVLGLLGVVGATRYALVAAPSERSYREWLDTAAPAPAPVYREPADEALVDALADRVRGRYPVMHSPDPQPVDIAAPAVEPLGHVAPELAAGLPQAPVSPYRVTLADLVAGARYVVPAATRHVSTEPATAPRHYSGTIDASATQTIGKHRALDYNGARRRELVAA